MSKKVRHPVKGAIQAPTSTAMRIRTRINATENDMVVLDALARHFDRLCGADLAARCQPVADEARGICALAGFVGSLLGRFSVVSADGTMKHKTPPSAETMLWAMRKAELTSACSSRFAGWITKSSNDAYSLARRNQVRTLADKEKAIKVVEKKLKLTIHTQAERKDLIAREAERAKSESRKPRRLDFGYRSTHEHAMKRRRLEHLRYEAGKLRADMDDGRVHITRGGKALARNRLHLGEAGITEDQWQARWHAKRRGFGANGEAGKIFGNETIRVSPEGILEVDLPPAFAHMANVTKRGVTRYRFEAPVKFAYRSAEWLAQVEANRAVAYEMTLAENGRVYLDASFTPVASVEVASLDDLLRDPGLRVLALDLNHGFLAPAVLDRSGNPIERLAHIPFATEGLPASRRDGHLRQTIGKALDLAELHGCRLIVVENLGFDEMRATGREAQASTPWFRKVVCGMPTAQFRDRLVAMASRRGIAVVGVPAAYSSIWGNQYWQKPLSTKSHKVSGHTAAAVVLGRRALGHRARRKVQASPGAGTPEQSIEEAARQLVAGVSSYHVRSADRQGGECEGAERPPRREGFHHPGGVRPEAADVDRRASRLAKTVRASRVSLKGT
ncbi:MAG: hypothetical protein ACYCTL_13860 [Acidimicrobiales bacterium]